MSEAHSFVELRTQTRQTFPVGKKIYTLKPGNNKIPTKAWHSIRGGLGKPYVDRGELIRGHEPRDDRDTFHTVPAERGIVPTRASQMHRDKARHDDRVRILEAQISKMLADKMLADKAAEPGLPFDPSGESVNDAIELLDALSADELTLVLTAEIKGKNRSSLVAAISKAIRG
jgi:hypothetical protein